MSRMIHFFMVFTKHPQYWSYIYVAEAIVKAALCNRYRHVNAGSVWLLDLCCGQLQKLYILGQSADFLNKKPKIV